MTSETLMKLHDTIPALLPEHGEQRAALREAASLLRATEKFNATNVHKYECRKSGECMCDYDETFEQEV